MKPFDDSFFDMMVSSSFGNDATRKGGYVRKCPKCGAQLKLDDRATTAIPDSTHPSSIEDWLAL